METFWTYLKCFAVGGMFCVLGQLLIDYTKLTPARILTLFVVAGVVLGALGLTASAGGICAAVVFGLLAALLSRPKDKNR